MRTGNFLVTLSIFKYFELLTEIKYIREREREFGRQKSDKNCKCNLCASVMGHQIIPSCTWLQFYWLDRDDGQATCPGPGPCPCPCPCSSLSCKMANVDRIARVELGESGTDCTCICISIAAPPRRGHHRWHRCIFIRCIQRYAANEQHCFIVVSLLM